MPLAALAPILLGAAGTSAAATTAAWGAIAAGTSAVTGLIGASKQAGAIEDSAKLQTDASAKASADQLTASREAIAWQQQQAQYAAQAAEVDRRANYEQFAAKQRRLGSIGSMLGLGGVEVPAYVPGATPNFSTPVSVGAGQTPAAAAARPGVVAPGGGVRMPANFGAAVNGPRQVPMSSSMPPAPPVSLNAPPPWMNDWTPRDPKTGQPIQLSPIVAARANPYASFGAYLGA